MAHAVPKNNHEIGGVTPLKKPISVESTFGLVNKDGDAVLQPGARALGQLSAAEAASSALDGTSTDEQAFDVSASIPANHLTPGSRVRILALIHIEGLNGTPNYTSKLKVGGNAVSTQAAYTSGVDDYILHELECTVMTAGASGTINGFTQVRTTGETVADVGPINGGSVDTTAAVAVTVTGQWGTGHASNVAKLVYLTVDYN